MMELPPNQTKSLDLVDKIPIVIKMFCQGKFMPLEVSFHYRDSGQLKAYISLSSVTPNQYDHDEKKIGRPTKFKFCDKNRSHVVGNWSK